MRLPRVAIARACAAASQGGVPGSPRPAQEHPSTSACDETYVGESEGPEQAASTQRARRHSLKVRGWKWRRGAASSGVKLVLTRLVDRCEIFPTLEPANHNFFEFPWAIGLTLFAGDILQISRNARIRALARIPTDRAFVS